MSAAFSLQGKRVWVAGHRGMVGSATVRALARHDVTLVSSEALDLRRQTDTLEWLRHYQPEVIILAAAKVGGIAANSEYPADFLYDNLMIEANVIEAAFRTGTKKLLFLGSTCIYPRNAPQPLQEEALLTGPLEPTNEWYAIAKIAGIKLCQSYRQQHDADFISAMPTNLYGPGDSFNLANCHVLPAMMRKIHEAKQAGTQEVVIWGTGKPLREFMHVDDLAEALVFLLQNYSAALHINVGTSSEVSILELAQLLARVIGYNGRFRLDPSKPDGTPRKLTDTSRLRALGFRPNITLESGLTSTYQWFLEHEGALRN